MAKRKRASLTLKPPPSPPICSSLHNPSADAPSSRFYSSFLRSPNNHKLLGFALVVLSPYASAPFPGSSAVPSNGSDDYDMVNSENDGCFVDDSAKRSRADLFSSRVLDGKGKNSDGLAFEFEAQAGSPLGKKLEALVGAECILEGKGSDVCVRVEDGTALYAIHLGYDEDLGCEEEDSVLTDLTDESCRSIEKSLQDPLQTPESKVPGSLCSNVLDLQDGSASSDNGRRCSASVTPKQGASMTLKQMSPSFTFSGRKSRKRVSMGSSIIYQMHKLSVQNDVKIQGWVVKSSEQGRDARVVVLLDVLLPGSLWSTHNYWKASPQTATALTHLSCDWKCRTEILESADLITGKSTIPGTENIWYIGACNVLGCKMHMKSTERFDLHDIFSCLSKQDPEAVSHRSPIQPDKPPQNNSSGFWDLSNDVLIRIFGMLSPKDLLSISAVCRQTRIVASAVIPCMNLNLFPHQRAAVCWMLNREANPQVFLNPIYQVFKTDEDFYFYLNTISGEIALEMPPEISDFRGGLFCDEPGLGKTVTALALILKTQGILSQPPPGIKVSWCKHSSHGKVGYYEVTTSFGLPAAKRCSALKAQRFDGADCETINSDDLFESSSQSKRLKSCLSSEDKGTLHRTGMLRKKLFDGEKSFQQDNQEKLIVKWKSRVTRSQVKASFAVSDSVSEEDSFPFENNEMKSDKTSECWVQCDACTKWRKLFDWQAPPKEGVAWFCSMNVDTEHQNCSVPEESWDKRCKINSLPGFVREDGARCDEKNVKFFTDELKLRANIFNIEAKRALNWLANLSPIDLRKLVRGISVPHCLRLVTISGSDLHYYDKFFQAFGLVQYRDRKGGAPKWCYPTGLNNLVFDVEALKVALSKPVQEVTRMYLSRATLIVVPSNLVEHWKDQITKHTKHNQLKWHVWTDQKSSLKPHILAWDYDIVITTFPRLSAEWSCRESSALMQIHWFRIILDEGHTLGVSLSLTNKLQMAVSMCASRRWVLTGTPLPDTPTNQVVHLQPILRFLHDDVYGQHVKLWESAILRPFESGCEIGRVRLLQLLQRCMISARKADLHHIPPCIRKVKLLDFTEKHAATYNELVVTVRRNILMADWNDPDHIESLLNPKQWKLRSTTVRNVRLSCCVAGHIKVRNAGEDIKETMDILIDQGMDPNSAEYDNIRNALFWGGNCKRCNEWCRLPILTPCVHLLCLSCVAIDREKCPLISCGHPYKMQMPEDMTRPENPNPKWPVPQDLIELQPSYVQENWHPEWQATSSSKVAYLIEQLKAMDLLNAKNENPVDDFHLASIMYEPSLHRRQDGAPEKAIVFSQFLEHISVINMQLTLANINHVGMYSPMPASHKMKSLKTFQDDPNCVVLVMDGTAALGLDLSFVTRVYLMEPIWDRSLEEQVVSRAHRMGATRPVLVETLAMRGTIEEQMLNFLQGPISICSPSDKLQRKHHVTAHEPAEGWYLEHLSFVKTDRTLVSTNEVLPLI